ncbi:MAG: DUF1385 domain-containing protein [Lachnospiraceae bacterium]|nr:DUF1385 domain-containing protein [Lachnospiraceae bacterium]
MKSSGIGGQAVMEGIMMKNGDTYAVAVRKPDKEIVVKKDVHRNFIKNEKLTKLPFIRGVFNFIDSLVLGMSTLTYSAEFYEEEEEPTKVDHFFEKVMGGFGEKFMMGMTVAISIIMAIGIFMILPYFLAELFKNIIVSDLVLALLEGVIRVAILLGYILLISKIEDIQRVFMYHGAEHKCINCIENGLELNVENVMKSSKEHKRCGTSFLLVVMFVSIIFFLFIRVDSAMLRVVLRILLVPVIAGVSYEFIRLAGRSENKVVIALSKPGMLLQKLTTKEPDESMVEVAIKAVEAVFDWQEFLEENKAEFAVAKAGKAENKAEKAKAGNEAEAVKTESGKTLEKGAGTEAKKTAGGNAQKNVSKGNGKKKNNSKAAVKKNAEQAKGATKADLKKETEVVKDTVKVDVKKEAGQAKDVVKETAKPEAEQEPETVPEYSARKTPVVENPTEKMEEDKKIPAPRITSVDDSENGVIKLTWDKVRKASGYVIYRKNANEDVYKLYPDIKKNMFDDTEIEPKMTYYYKVRAYVTKGDKKVYGQFSPIESNGYSSRIKSKY